MISFKNLVSLFIIGSEILSSQPLLAETAEMSLGGGRSLVYENEHIVSNTSLGFTVIAESRRVPTRVNCLTNRSSGSYIPASAIKEICRGGYLHWEVITASKVRNSPNGSVQCVVRGQQQIDVLGSAGNWAVTNACGARGYISASQVKLALGGDD